MRSVSQPTSTKHPPTHPFHPQSVTFIHATPSRFASFHPIGDNRSSNRFHSSVSPGMTQVSDRMSNTFANFAMYNNRGMSCQPIALRMAYDCFACVSFFWASQFWFGTWIRIIINCLPVIVIPCSVFVGGSPWCGLRYTIFCVSIVVAIVCENSDVIRSHLVGQLCETCFLFRFAAWVLS